MPKPKSDVVVKPLPEADVKEAARICKLAFGTFLGVPDPMQVFGDRDFLESRWRAQHTQVLGAYLDDELVGSNVMTRWGSYGFFGPLTVRPDFWDRGIASQLMKPTMETFARWRTTQEGLFTFPDSPKHIGLYEKFGFKPQLLTPVLTKKGVPKPSRAGSFSAISKHSSSKGRAAVLKELRELTSKLYLGLDLTDEINATDAQKLGDTIIVNGGSQITGFAICQSGTGSEGGSDNCYVKFGGVLPGTSAESRFRTLISAIEGYASRHRLGTIEAGVNRGCSRAYREMTAVGFQTGFTGIVMQRPDKPGFHRPETFCINDLR